MVEEAKSQSWWKTIPGILTTVTAMVTAVTGLIVALHQVGLLQGAKEPAKAATLVRASEVDLLGAFDALQEGARLPVDTQFA